VNAIKSAVYIAFGIGTPVVLFPYEVGAPGLEVPRWFPRTELPGLPE
jgi:hypothetical protein